MGPPIIYLTSTKWLWNPHVENPKKNIVGMGVHKIVKQMGKNNLKNRVKTATLEKWTRPWHQIECITDIHF
jgi:hypothetical protein